ncbi:MAG: adenine deaminase [Muribaculaceae bacterium]|nr:adenine deaminase [Muribaculaceae bacterium]
MEHEFKGHIVDVISREIYDGVIVVDGDKIVAVEKCELPKREKAYPYLMPGFIDSHVHIESSMMVPQEFARIAVSHGTIGAVADPHEIGNVMGVKGVEYMVNSGRRAIFNFCFGAPSCVPAVGGDVESSGATIDADDIEKLMASDDIGFLAEMMNYVGVLNDDPQVMAKIASAKKRGKPIDGHAPGLVGDERERYAQAGVSTDHECSTLDEGRACVKAGMKVIIREGSAAKDYKLLSPLIAEAPDSVMFCTDDCHPDDFVREHINAVVKRALDEGYDLWDVLQAACVNPQRHYGVRWGLLQKGDPATFIVVDKLGPHLKVQNTIIKGIEVYSYNYSFGAVHAQMRTPYELNDTDYPNRFEATPITVDDIKVEINRGTTAHIIRAADASLLTQHEEVEVTGNPLVDSRHLWTQVQKIVVYNRYDSNAKPVMGLVRGFHLHDGAIAGTVAHDCHNIVAIGTHDEYIVSAINRLIEMKGGQVAIHKEEMLDIPLPIAGLMSPLGAHELAYRTQLIHEMVENMGCTMKSPFITMAFLCLPVIPDIKITDKVLWDSLHMCPIK